MEQSPEPPAGAVNVENVVKVADGVKSDTYRLVLTSAKCTAHSLGHSV